MNKTGRSRVKYREVQQFRKVWFWVCLLPFSLFLVAFFGYGMVTQLIFGHPWGSNPMNDGTLTIIGPLMILVGIGISMLFYVTKMITEVLDDGLYIRYFPLATKTISFDEISRYESRTYRPLKEYGGWGIRGGRHGRAYNVSGNRGVLLDLTNGKSIMIGSQRPEELARAIEEQMKALGHN